MRILIYSLNYAPEPTSTGKYTGELAAWLASRGHEVDAIAGTPHYPQWAVAPEYRDRPRFLTEQLEGVHVMRAPMYIPPPDRVTAGRRIVYELTFCCSALRYWLPRWLGVGAGRKRYDVVIAVCPPAQLGMWPWVYHLTRRVPWVFHVQDMQVDAAMRLGMLKQRAVGKLLHRIETFLLRRATVVSTITTAMRNRLLERGVAEERAWLVPNWANLDLVEPQDRDNAFRRSLGVRDDQVLFMYAGNLGVKQGLEVLLEAADALREDDRFRFAIVGSGAAEPPLRARLAQLQLKNVAMLPVQPREALSQMLAAADVHLVIQRRDAADLVMPSKLTNILAAGRPSIATADPDTALALVLQEAQSGLACEPQSVGALVEAMRQLADDAQMRREMGYNARRYATTQLNQDGILLSFESRLQDLAGTTASPTGTQDSLTP